MSLRVLVAGFQHETNTFASSRADRAAFEAGAGYPEATRGAAMLARLGGTVLPMGGFIRDAAARGWTLVPSIWAGATPSGPVSREAFEWVAAALRADAHAALADGRLDAVYLDLHGAAVAEHVDDCEGELLERLRAVVGPAMPVVASLDLHAHVSERMLALATAMTALRTYPHVDMAETGARAAALLALAVSLARRGRRLHAASARLPFLLPLNAQCTQLEPANELFADLADLETQSPVALSFAMGFPAADIPECGPVVFGHGEDAAALRANVDALAANAVARRADWRLDLLSPGDAVARALAHAGRPGTQGPVVIADTQDNPGAGGEAATTGLLHALLAAGAGARFPRRVALGLLHDAQAAAAACAAGAGAECELTMGRSVAGFIPGERRMSEPPLVARARVLATSAEGRVALAGPMTAGNTVVLGPCAAVDVQGVVVLLASAKTQMLDLDLMRFLGVEPRDAAVLVVKSSVHFRAAFEPLASRILVARATGPMAADPADLPWRRLPAGIARRP